MTDRRLVLLLGALSALGPASTDIYLGATPRLADDFGVSSGAANLTLAAFMVGMAGGQLAAGSLCDVFGRRRPILVALVVYMGAALACALAPSLATLLAARFVQGLMAATGVVVARAIVRDLFSGPVAARHLSHMVAIYGISPVLAPVIGSQLLSFISWRGLFICLVGFAGLLLIATAALLPETLAVQERRARGFGLTFSAFGSLLGDRVFVGYALVLGCSSGATLAYIAASPFVLQGDFGVSAQLYGVLFACGAASMIAGSQINARLVGRLGPRRLLVGSIVCVVLIGVVLVTFATVGSVPVVAVLPFLFLFMMAWGFVPANSLMLAMAEHPRQAGSASALLGLSQYGMAAIAAPLSGIGIGSSALLPMALVILVLAVLAAVSGWTLAVERPSEKVAA